MFRLLCNNVSKFQNPNQLYLIQFGKDSKNVFSKLEEKGNEEYSFPDFWVFKGTVGLFVSAGWRPGPGNITRVGGHSASLF